MSAAHTPMVVAAARVLCNRMADACNFDYEDTWSDFGVDYLEDAKAALDAAGVPELLELLEQTLAYTSGSSWSPSLTIEIDAAIDKATGAPT